MFSSMEGIKGVATRRPTTLLETFEGAYEVVAYRPGLSNRFLLQPGVLEKLALVLERLSVDEEAYH